MSQSGQIFLIWIVHLLTCFVKSPKLYGARRKISKPIPRILNAIAATKIQALEGGKLAEVSQPCIGKVSTIPHS